MTTDTAARVTRIVIRDQSEYPASCHPILVRAEHSCIIQTERLQDISYVDRPDIKISADSDVKKGARPSESINMPFKYVKADDGKPVMPKVDYSSRCHVVLLR